MDPFVGAGEGGIGHQDRVVAAHGQGASECLRGLLGAHRQVRDGIGHAGVDQAQRLLDGVLVERIDDRLGAGAIEAQVIGVALVRARGRDLLDADDDLHDVGAALLRQDGPRFATPARARTCRAMMRRWICWVPS